jgi:hypothetical protein
VDATQHAGLSRDTLLEVIGYAGATAALAAGLIAVGEASGTGVQVLTSLVISAVLFLAGWAIANGGSEIFQRMRSVFWFGSAFAFLALVGDLVGEGLDLRGRGGAVLTGLLATGFAAFLWWTSKRSLQAIAMILFAWITLIQLVMDEGSDNFTTIGVMTWLFGIVVLVAGAAGILLPRRTALSLGAVGAVLLGPVLIGSSFNLFGGASGPDTVAILLGLVMAVVLVFVGDVMSERVASGFGIAGILFHTLVLVSEKVNDQGPAIAVLVVGLVLLGVAIVLAGGSLPGVKTMMGGGAPPAPPMPPAPPPEPPMSSPH